MLARRAIRPSSRHSMLLSLSDDELQLVHEAVRLKALSSCVRCCKRLRIAAMASGRLALLAASVGDLESVKWAHLHARPLSREMNAGMLCRIAAARADLRMLRWALENGGVGLLGSDVMHLAIASGSLEMVRAVHDHGVPIDFEYFASAAITGHIAMVQWLASRDLDRSRGVPMCIAAGCAAAHGHLELLKWLTVEQYEKHASGTRLNVASGACWGRYILAAAARGGHVEIIEWARRIGYATTTPGRNDDARKEWVRAGNEAKAAAEKKQRELAGQRERLTVIREMPWKKACDFLAEEINEIQALIVRTQC